MSSPHRNSKTSLRWAWRLSVAAGAACTCTACTATITATDGRVFHESKDTPDSVSSALLASAARDLPCATENLDVTRLDPERRYAVTGCGRGVVYRVLTPSLTTRRVELVASTPVAATVASPTAVLPSATGRGPASS